MNKTEKTIALSLVAVIVILTAVLFLRPDPPPEVVVGEFTPPAFESAARSGAPDTSSVADFGTLHLAPDLAVSLCASPVVENGQVKIYFTSPATNTGWMRLQLTDTKGNLLGETGLIRPGEYVEAVDLIATPKHTRALVRILTYQPETYYSMGSANAEIRLNLN